MNVYQIITLACVLFFSVIFHEIAHGWVAYRLGDPTAKLAGRLTLNPFPHIDLIGTILLPVVLVLMHSPIVLGWAKPVPVDFSLLRNPKRDMIWVGLSGPFVNILIALGCSLLLHLDLLPALEPLFKTGIVINLVLAIFNLLPIPPLDGSRFVMGVLPYPLARAYARVEPYGIIIVFLLLYFGVLGSVIWPAVNFFAYYLGV